MKLGLIGETLGHSLSPCIHRKIFGRLGISGTYDLVEIGKGEWQERMEQALASYDGLNVTIPYKTAVIPFLDEISEEARRIGAVNTIAVRNGKIKGYNTDYAGFSRTLRKIGAEVSGRRCVVLGSGGASRAVIQCLSDEGADVSVISRHPENLGEDFISFAHRCGAKIYSYGTLEWNPHGTLLVNTTPVGMFPHAGVSPVSPRVAGAFPKVIDIIYNPKETELLSHAKTADRANGMYMLVMQAVAAEEIWTGAAIPPAVAEAVAEEMENGAVHGRHS